MNNLTRKQKSLIALIVLTALSAVLLVSTLNWSLNEDGSLTVWLGGSYDLLEHQTTDQAGNSYTYFERVNDTRNIIFQTNLDTEWLDFGEYDPASALFQQGNLILSWNADKANTDTDTSNLFWNCYHALNICMLVES